MRKIVLAAVAVAGILTISACKKEEAPVAAETSAEATEAAPMEASTDTAAATDAATAAASEAPKM